MTRYPLLLGFRDLVAGNGYIADIALSNGRALLVDEGDGFWMYGVNPGGMAAGGASLGEAQAEFRTAYKSVLFDIAAEAESFEAFKAEVERFLTENEQPHARGVGRSRCMMQTPERRGFIARQQGVPRSIRICIEL